VDSAIDLFIGLAIIIMYTHERAPFKVLSLSGAFSFIFKLFS